MGNTCCSPKFQEIKDFFTNMYVSKIPFTMLMKIVYLRWQNGLDELNWKYLVDSILCKDLKSRKEVIEYTQFWMRVKHEYKASTLILALLIVGYDRDINDKENFKRYFSQFIRYAFLQGSLKHDENIKSGRGYYLISLLKEAVECYISLISYDCISIDGLILLDSNTLDNYRSCFTKSRINNLVDKIFAEVQPSQSDLEADGFVEINDFVSLLDSKLNDHNEIRETLMKQDTLS